MRNSRRSARRTQNESYVNVAKNIYLDGSSYRVRVSVDGVRYSRNCSSKREAIQWRNQMLAERA